MKRMEKQQQEMIHSYLERDVMLRQAARLAMFESETQFKAAATEYERIDSDLESHLLDYAESLGYEPFEEPLLPRPA